MAEYLVSEIATIDSKLDMKLKSAELNDIARAQNVLNDLRTLLSEYNKKINELDNEIQDTDEQNLINKLKGLRNDYNIKKTKVNKIEEKVTFMINNQKFQRGELKGQELRTAERSAIKELHKETDYQGDLVDEIANDIRGANDDLKDIGQEVDKQGQQIEKISQGVNQADSTVKRTDNNINQMTKRAFCMKFIMTLLVVILFLLDVALLIWKLCK